MFKLFLSAVLASTTVLAACTGVPPKTLGIRDGSLSPCPATPNCVISRPGDTEHGVSPLLYTGSPEDALKRLTTIVAGMPRSRIVTATDIYLHAEFRSLIFRFVDDAEFLIDDTAKSINVRSAARMGTYDFGVNRRRIESIRSAWLAETAQK